MPKDKEELKEEKDKKNKKIQALEEELAKLKADVDYWKNEYYRAYADTKNLRNNLEKEHSDIIKYRAMGFIEDLLPVLDSFHMALANEPTDAALKAYLTGFQYIYKNLVKQLREVKNERQIIIATHSATIVTNSMTDQVCLMCSDGEHGWIEKSGYPSEPIIKKHIVNYLEGGIESFKHKQKLYASVLE